jgi:hypothetical protein
LLFQAAAIETYLQACRVLIKDLKGFAEKTTQQIRAAARAAAEAAGRPVRHLASPQQSKEELARKIAREDGIASGLIAVLSAVEPCLSYTVRGDRQSKEKHMVLEPRKCTHLYHYYRHPEFGLLHGGCKLGFHLPWGCA